MVGYLAEWVGGFKSGAIDSFLYKGEEPTTILEDFPFVLDLYAILLKSYGSQ
jgi:hypothetical protein